MATREYQSCPPLLWPLDTEREGSRTVRAVQATLDVVWRLGRS